MSNDSHYTIWEAFHKSLEDAENKNAIRMRFSHR